MPGAFHYTPPDPIAPSPASAPPHVALDYSQMPSQTSRNRMRRLALFIALVALALPLASCSKQARKERALRRAESYFAAGQYDQAKVEYLNVVRFEPLNAVAYARLGSIWLDEGAPLRAAPYLLKARELAPENLDNRLKLARVLIGVGHRADGFTEVMYVLDRSPNDSMAARVAAEAAQAPEERERVDQAIARMPNQNDAGVQLAIATSAMRRGDREATIKSIELALKTDPKLAAAHSFMATLWLIQKQPKRAAEEFKAAAELSPARSAERLRYAQFQIQSGATDDAINTLRAITNEAPDFLPAWLLQADISLGKKNYEESQRSLTNIFNRDPDNIDANIFQARVRIAKGEVEQAIQGLEQLDSRLPDFGPVKVELARAHAQMNNPTQAIAVLNQALANNPGNLEAAMLLGRINLSTGQSQAVVDSMKALLEKHPDLGSAKLLLADAYRGLGQLDNAATIFREQLQATPNIPEAHLALGIILRQQKKETEAREMFEKARQLAPGNPMALLQLVDMALVSRDFPQAEQLVQEQMQKTPKVALIHLLQGRVYAAQSKWNEAETALSEATKLNPNLVEAYALLATVYTAANKLPQAIQQLEAVVERAPKDTRGLMSLAVLHEKTQNFEKARDSYEKVITISPDFAAALNNLAFLYVERFNDLERAYQLAQKARSLQPGDVSIADTLGWVLFKRRDYQQALPLLAEAADKAPNQSEILYHLGMCHYMMGATENARAAFEQALKSGNEFTHKEDIQRRLALLSSSSSGSQLTIQELESIVRQQPDDVLSHMRLAESYETANSFKQAAAQYEEALKLNPKLTSAFAKLASIYSEGLNDPTKGLEYAKTARELSPGDARSTLLVGRIAFKQGNYPWAYGLLKQSSDQLEGDATAHHSLAWAAFTMGKIPEATHEMEQVIKLAPDSPLAEDAKSWLAMMRLTDPANITADSPAKVSALLKKDPNYAPAQAAEAAIAAQSNNPDRAIALYERLLVRFPDYVPAQKQLAKVYAKRPADLQKGYDVAFKARKNLPDDNELTRLLADISYQQKEYARAVEFLKESARKEPLDANHLYYLGICSLQTKDTAQARKALTQALDNGLAEPLAADARRALEDLGRN